MPETPLRTLETLEREIRATKPDRATGARFVSVDTRVLEWLIADSRSLAYFDGDHGDR